MHSLIFIAKFIGPKKDHSVAGYETDYPSEGVLTAVLHSLVQDELDGIHSLRPFLGLRWEVVSDSMEDIAGVSRRVVRVIIVDATNAKAIEKAKQKKKK